MKKKKWIILLGILFIAVLIIVVIRTNLIVKTGNVLFYLEEKYYGKNTMIEIETGQLENLIDAKESFAVFVHEPMCSASYSFHKVLLEFGEKNNLSFFKITFEEMASTELGKKVKYYPSFVIFQEGEPVAYLDAESDAHLPYYETVEGFAQWFGRYVKLNEGERDE
ncbi:MAG: hypothetical protein IJ274_05315 [Lachnospiraceae bacterium]|nr:hypothetical protein [Lachnospiraceae bacterium]